MRSQQKEPGRRIAKPRQLQQRLRWWWQTGMPGLAAQGAVLAIQVMRRGERPGFGVCRLVGQV